VSAAILLRTWILNPREHAPSYKQFLDRHGAQSLSTYRQLNRAAPVGLITTCEVRHPGQGHFEAFLRMFWEGIKLSVPVYLPVHLLGTALAQKRSLSVFLDNMIRSTTFLAGYCATAWLMLCAVFKVSPGVTANKHYLTGFCGLWVLIERPSRQIELAHYCMTHALNAIWGHMKLEAWVRPRPQYTPLLLASVVSLVLAQFNKQPKFIIKVLFGLDFSP